MVKSLREFTLEKKAKYPLYNPKASSWDTNIRQAREYLLKSGDRAPELRNMLGLNNPRKVRATYYRPAKQKDARGKHPRIRKTRAELSQRAHHDNSYGRAFLAQLARLELSAAFLCGFFDKELNPKAPNYMPTEVEAKLVEFIKLQQEFPKAMQLIMLNRKGFNIKVKPRKGLSTYREFCNVDTETIISKPAFLGEQFHIVQGRRWLIFRYAGKYHNNEFRPEMNGIAVVEPGSGTVISELIGVEDGLNDPRKSPRLLALLEDILLMSSREFYYFLIDQPYTNRVKICTKKQQKQVRARRELLHRLNQTQSWCTTFYWPRVIRLVQPQITPTKRPPQKASSSGRKPTKKKQNSKFPAIVLN